MKNSFLIILLFFSAYIFGQNEQTSYETVSSFFPSNEFIQQQKIEWGKFTVPENWDNPDGKKIKLAVTTLKNTSNKENAEAIIMIEGGPGASAGEGIWWWIDNPLRKNYDVILLDTRGTGFSEPRLCPDLGKDFFKILAKNQTPSEDEKQKVAAALACQKSLIANNIDVNNYHSETIATDIHALKKYFQYAQWNVYGVSYGTYIAQVYTKAYPSDVKALILDSPIAEISEYYEQNTTNYLQSLEKVFRICENNPECNAEYPNLEATYYEVIQKLKDDPITVKVDKNIISTGEFTYNVEDFKVAIQQALYQYKLIEVLPMLIYEFHNDNEDTLSALVAAFSGALGLDYGVYYCITCNETIPNNSLEAYNEDVKKQKSLMQGLSFYSSDFKVCEQWNLQSKLKQTLLDTTPQKISVPTLLFSGGFDPITPSKNAEKLAKEIENSQWIDAKALGHAAGFSPIGFQTTNAFLQNPTKKLENNFNMVKTGFVKDIHFNGGVAKMANSFQNLDVLFFVPLGIALIISFIAIFSYIFSFFKKQKKRISHTIIQILLMISSILAIIIIVNLVVAIQDISSQNFYVLAFGLPEKYSYLFNLLLPFIICTCIATVLFFIDIKHLKDRSVTFAILFSNILIVGYLFYWELV